MYVVISNELKKQIDRYAKKKGLKKISYRELAKEVGISHASLWKMSTGQKYNPTLDMLDKLCHFFKCKVGDILEHRKGKY